MSGKDRDTDQMRRFITNTGLRALSIRPLTEGIADAITPEMIDSAMQALIDAPYRLHEHVFAPWFAGRRVARTMEETEVTATCASCFQPVALTAVVPR